MTMPMPMPMTIEQFKKLVADHDLTYNYSDDINVWRHGLSQREAIEEAAKQFPREDVVKIWNDEVDRKIRPGFGEHFKWKVGE